MTRPHVAALAAACLAMLASAPAFAAATIAEDSFVVDIVIDDGAGGTVSAGPFSAIAKAVDDNYFSGADMNEYFDAGGVEHNLRINWLDADSFDLFLNAGGAYPLTTLRITLSDLDFTDAGTPRAIVGASFNRAASNVDTYAAGPGMPSPGVSFAGRSVTAEFGFFPAELVGDGPRLRFDVVTQTAAVPEPGTYALLMSGLVGLGGLGLARRRQARGLASAAMRS